MKKLGVFLAALAIGLFGCSTPQTAPPSPGPESGPGSPPGKAVPVSSAYEYDRGELWVQRDGNRIYGEIFVPKDAGKNSPR